MDSLSLIKEPSAYNRTHDVNIIKLDLVCLNDTYDLIPDALIELNIFESIYEPQITGHISMLDSFGIIEKGPITGDEKLVVSFQTSDEGGYAVYSKTFEIFKLTERKDLNGRKAQSYVLHFATSAMNKNQTVRIQRSFKDMTEDQIVSIVAKNQLGISNIRTEGCKYAKTFVVPAWRPYYLINYMAKKAIRPIGDSPTNYLFYEDQKKHNFVSIDLLMEQAPVFTLSNQIARVSKGSSIMKFNAEKYELIKNFDTLADSARGMYAAKLTVLDFEKKEYVYETQTYNSHFGGTVHFEPNKVRTIPPSEPERMFNVASNYNVQDKIKEWILHRPMDIQQMEHWVWEIDMQGYSDLIIGSVIEFDAPKHDYTVESGLDSKLSGNYLLTSVRHTINYRTHAMTIELQKPNLKS